MKITNAQFQRFFILSLSFENEALRLPVVRRLVVGLDGERLLLADGRTGHIVYQLCVRQSLEEYQAWYDNGLPVMVSVDNGASPYRLSDVSPDVHLNWDLGPVWAFIDGIRSYNTGAMASMLSSSHLTLDEILDLPGRRVQGANGRQGLVLSLVARRNGCNVMVDGTYGVETCWFDQLKVIQPQLA